MEYPKHEMEWICPMPLWRFTLPNSWELNARIKNRVKTMITVNFILRFLHLQGLNLGYFIFIRVQSHELFHPRQLNQIHQNLFRFR